MPSRHDTEQRNASVEGLRGFSASLVVLYHVFNMGGAAGILPVVVAPAALSAVEETGPFGVDLFFIISGYLIVQTLIRHGNVRRFLVNRALRIYPAFVPLHLLLFVLGPLTGYAWMAAMRHHPGVYMANFVSNLLFLPGLFPLPLAQKNAWSLSYEAGFYLVTCLFFVGMTARAEKSHAKALLFLLLGAVVTAAALVFHPIAAFFLVGVAAYIREKSPASDVVLPLWQTACGPLFLVMAFASIAFGGASGLVAALPLTYLFFRLIVREQGILARALQTPVFRFLGRISYSLYLVHPFVLDPLRSAARHFRAGGVAPAALAAGFVVLGILGSVALATLFWRVFERALTRRLTQRVNQRTPLVLSLTR